MSALNRCFRKAIGRFPASQCAEAAAPIVLIFERFSGWYFQLMAMCHMNYIKYFIGILSAVGGLALSPTLILAKDQGSPLDVARQLNNAFIEVAEKVSPAVVVIQVWHKPS